MNRIPSVCAAWLLLGASCHILLAQQPLQSIAAIEPAGIVQDITPAPGDPARGPWRSEWISVDRASFGFVQNDQTLVAEGAGYHVTFDRGSFRFLPALGRTAPADRPVTFAVETIVRSDSELYRAGGAEFPQQPALAADGATACWNRGAILERFEARADGIEHSFVFPERPVGTGDLIVRLRVDTDLQADAGRDLRQLELLEPGIGKVTIGAVTGIDALGVHAPGSLHFDGRHLELVLPARFVDSAAYPMVLDPLIGSALLTGAAADNDRAPDCAYDLSTDRYLVVWERFFSTYNVVARGRLVQSNGTFYGPSFITITDQGGLNETNPKVANINYDNGFVVVWVQGSVGSDMDIACRMVRGDGTLAPILVVATGSSNQVDPDVGGDATLLNNDVMIVFRDATAGIIELRQVDFDPITNVGTLGAQMLIAGPYPSIGRPAISKSGGQARKYLVCWRDGSAYVGMRVVNHNATSWTIPGFIQGLDPEKVEVDGDGNQWTVVWNELEPGQPSGGMRNVWGVTIVAPATPGNVTVSYVGTSLRTIAANPLDDEAESAVAFYSNATTTTSTVAWYDATNRPASVLSGTNLQRPSNVRSGNPFTTGPTSGFQVRYPNFATKLSGGDPSHDGLLTFWANNLATLDGDVYVQLHRVHVGGPSSTVANGCSGGGQAGLDLALALGRQSHITLQQAASNATLGFLLIGDPSSPRTTCGPCTALSSSLIVAVGMNNGNAAFPVAVPGHPSFTGLTLDLQFVVVEPQLQTCTQIPGVAASNILRATIQD